MNKFLRKIFGIIFSKLRDKVFLVCLGLASVIWLLSKLNNVYTYIITVPMVITGAVSDYDKDFIATDDKIYYIDTKFEGKGLNLLKIMMKNKIVISPDNITIEKISGDNESYQVTTESLRAAFISKFPTVDVVNIINKRVILQTSFFSQKRIPLLSKITVDSAGEYMQIGNVYIEPDSVTIYGTKNIVDTVTRVFTESLKVEKAKEFIVGTVKTERNNNYEITPREVQYSIEMERYTEVKKIIPITMFHKKETQNYSIIPSDIEVTFNVAKNIFSQFDPTSIVFYIDTKLKSTKVEGDKYLIQHSKLPNGVMIRSINPTVVSVYENIVKE